MRKIITFLTVMLFAGAASAQYYMLPFVNAGENPSGLNVDDENPGTAGAAEVLAIGATDWSAAQTIPFTFDFNGNSYTSLYVAPEGVVTFTASSGTGPGINSALPSASIPDNSICAWGLNLSGTNDNVLSKTYGTAPNRQFWLTWVSATWSQGTGWAYWSIVIEETSNAIYIVDARNYVSAGTGVALTAGLQFDASTAMMVPGSPALASTNEATGGSLTDQTDNSYYAFFAGTQPDYDASMKNIDLPSYLQVNQGSEDIVATVSNYGTQTITDLELTYTVNGGTAVVASVSGLNIASGASATVTHPTGWTPTVDGNYTIEFWASMVNGNADANTFNDRTDMSLIGYSNSYPRTVLYETFTSSTCAPCVAGNANFEAVIAGLPADEVASIKYQMSWPGDGDPYNNADGNVRRTVYQISAVPGMEIDGGWDGNSNSYVASLHTDAMEVPAFVKIDAHYYVNVGNQTISTCATIESMQDMGTVKLHMAVKEHETTANVGTNGETEFLNVVKKMIPTADGADITITAGMTETICTEYTFNGDYRLPNNSADLIDDATEHSVEEFDDLGVVVWLQDASNLVLNSTNAVSSPVSVNNVSSEENTMSLYPNPANNAVTLTLNAALANQASIRVLNVVGKMVIDLSTVSLNQGSNRIELNTEALTSGVYFVQVTVDGLVNTSQLVIQK